MNSFGFKERVKLSSNPKLLLGLFCVRDLLICAIIISKKLRRTVDIN